MKRRLFGKRLLLLGLAMSALLLPQPEPAAAVAPTLSLSSGYNIATNSATIHIGSSGFIELPDGNVVNTSADYEVLVNGIYSFTSITNEGRKTQSIAVTSIKHNLLITNNPTVTLGVMFKDPLSGITKMRFANEAPTTYSAWANVLHPGQSGMETTPWTINTTGDGVKTIYAQFSDAAGNITDGGAFDQVIYDSTGPTYTSKRDIYYTNNPTFTFDVNSISDTYSTPTSAYASVDNVTYTKVSTNDWDNIAYTLPVAARTTGIKTIYVKTSDNLGNLSPAQTFTLYYDVVKPTGTVNVKNGDGTALEVLDYFNTTNDSVGGTENQLVQVKVAKSSSVKLELNLNDVHSGMVKNANGGVSKVTIMELLANGTWKATDITNIPSNVFTANYNLSYGLKKEIYLKVQDNAGNVYDSSKFSFWMSNLSLSDFRLTKIINPDSGNIYNGSVSILSNASLVELFAGTEVSVAADYNLLSAQKPISMNGQLQIQISKRVGGTETIVDTVYTELTSSGINGTGPLYNGTFTGTFELPYDIYPDDETKYYVLMQGFVKATFSDGNTLVTNFPNKNANVYQKIGEISDSIQNRVQFKAVQ